MNHPYKIILIADDDREDQELLTDMIVELEPRALVHCVENGKQVIDYLDACEDRDLPGLMILDYSMPELSGPEVLKALCSKPRYKNLPKLVWSTSNAKGYIEECMRSGATEYFVKPNNMTQLKAMAQKMLTMSHLAA